MLLTVDEDNGECTTVVDDLCTQCDELAWSPLTCAEGWGWRGGGAEVMGLV